MRLVGCYWFWRVSRSLTLKRLWFAEGWLMYFNIHNIDVQFELILFKYNAIVIVREDRQTNESFCMLKSFSFQKTIGCLTSNYRILLTSRCS